MGIRKWILPQQRPELVTELSGQTGLAPLPCAVLAARGCETAADVNAIIAAGGELADPYTIADMDKAVARIQQALEEGERIAVYGDYDCDGITSTALLTSYLQSVGADVLYYIPSREKEGYGMNLAAVDFLHSQGVGLIITVDNGISAHREVEHAKTLGMEVVVTDHHTPRDTLPGAVAVVNPHRVDDTSAFKHLAGVGVTFKLLCALEGDGGEELLEYYSDIVMLGTIADVVSLTGENRMIVRHGLSRLAETERPGLLALLDVSGLAGTTVGSEAVAFGLIPRLNAAGRMGCVDDAVELLLTDDVPYAHELAASISAQNEERKKIEAAMMEQIDAELKKNPQLLCERVLIASGEGWHHGVVGIVASKVMEKYGKPTILFSIDGDVARGSGRSMEGFSLIKAIDACSEHLVQYGGHTLAAGLTVPRDKLDYFIGQLQSHAKETYPSMPVPTCKIDCILTPRTMSIEAIHTLVQLEPYGQGMRAPLFLIERVKVEGIYPTSDKKHIRLRLAGEGTSFYAVYFRMCEEAFPYAAGDVVDVVANISAGEYNGKAQLSVKVKDLRLSGIPQDEILEEHGLYARWRAGELGDELAALAPQRDDFAVVYKFLRNHQGYRHGPAELCYRVNRRGVGYAKLRIILDVFEELGLIACDGAPEQAVVRLLPAGAKVELEKSKILTSLRV